VSISAAFAPPRVSYCASANQSARKKQIAIKFKKFPVTANRANDCCSCAISFRGPRLDGRKGPLSACSDAESEFLATLAFAMPLIAMLAAMSLSGIGRPTVAQLRAKRAALLAVAAPTLFTFVGVVLYMLRDPVPDTWLWVPC